MILVNTICNIIFIALIFRNVTFSESLIKNNPSKLYCNQITVRDTLYTLSNYIIEVCLIEQKIYFHKRNGETLEFLCSTGDLNLEKGVSTPEGIFVIHNKARKIYSLQFDSTLMINWMGFNYNIGFHALEGTSYYKYLGKRVSSHGCIRISREASNFLFSQIPIGTPVFIHSCKSARVIQFTDSSDIYKNPDKKKLIEFLNKNLKSLYRGDYLYKRTKVIISDKNVTHKGLPLGDETKISPQLPYFDELRPIHVNRRLFDVIKK